MTDSPIPVETRQRAVAEARARFARVGARTEAADLFETGGLRMRFPNAAGRCEAAIINTAGGGKDLPQRRTAGAARHSPRPR